MYVFTIPNSWNKIASEQNLQWLFRAGTGSGRVWRRSLGWVERSQQRRHTGDRRAGCPSTSPPTGRTHCACCTEAAHETQDKSIVDAVSVHFSSKDQKTDICRFFLRYIQYHWFSMHRIILIVRIISYFAALFIIYLFKLCHDFNLK